MARNFYYFNPKTLSFEKGKADWKKVVKRLLWFFAVALSFSVLFLWISFYLFDSPKERILQRENNELKEQLEHVNRRLDAMDVVLKDIQERDDNIYRSVFEADPVPVEQRYPFLAEDTKYDNLTSQEAKKLLSSIDKKSNRLIVQLAVQSRSLDTIADMASKKAEMLAAIPAIRPLKNMTHISSGFGRRYHPILKILRPHTGIDIAAPKGTPVYATADGVVSRESPGSGYGIAVVINHGYSYKTLYAHLTKKAVRAGQRVKRGDVIGYVGSTGLSFGPHLHYEVIKNGVPVNPVHYFFNDITPEEYDKILESSKVVNQALS
ncbi:MAG: peptidoglycan DD-metalloendopeptidase family protein [Bacteroidales bacterium]|nr:peptidoglycan DD-metalloendopeptidase family protein [Bacteroidales bacterium]